MRDSTLTALKELNALKKTIQVLEEFRKTHAKLELFTVIAFVTVGKMIKERGDTAIGMGEVVEHFAAPHHTISRQLRYLTATGSRQSKTAGPDWIEIIEDPDNFAKKLIKLTPQGALVLRSIAFLLEE